MTSQNDVIKWWRHNFFEIETSFHYKDVVKVSTMYLYYILFYKALKIWKIYRLFYRTWNFSVKKNRGIGHIWGSSGPMFMKFGQKLP